MRTTRCGDDVSTRRTSLRLTVRHRDMHRRLFGPETRQAVPVSDESVQRVLRDLRAAPQLRSFRLWLVGSRVDAGHQESDVDLVLSPRTGSAPDEQLIADALWYCREYALYGANDACVVDPCFRGDGPTTDIVPLPPHTMITTVKLLSPKLARLVMQGRIRQWRHCGDVGLEFVRRAADADYYGRLPLRDFDDAPCRYLRPAVEITDAAADFGHRRQDEAGSGASDVAAECQLFVRDDRGRLRKAGRHFLSLATTDGTEALFTSVVGGKALRARILALIDDACVKAKNHRVDMNIMAFAFTDSLIADALAAAAQHDGPNIRVIADWTQRATDGFQQVGRLAELAPAGLEIRYKKDQPYVWDPTDARMRWSYRASRGMLHHKTLSIIVDGEPWRLLCGSSNWSDTAAASYENLLILSDSTPECRNLMSRVEVEFEALWSDGTASLSAVDAQTHYEAIADSYRRNALAEPTAITGLARGHAEQLQSMNPQHYGALRCAHPIDAFEIDPPHYEIAFSARRPDETISRAGYSDLNSDRFIALRGPTGKIKIVPLTVTTLALDFIFRTRPGETLLVAMYGLSTRVPEYGALLDMARRGVRLRILLDGKVGRRTAESLSRLCQSERLPIQVKYGYRTMHQKYVVNTDSGNVLTGTANMSTDASARHSEHRVRILGHHRLARQFAADFETIWNRVGHPEKREGEQPEGTRLT